jgi:hypothetical protein
VIDGYEYGFAQGEDTVWCIRREAGGSRMLCGRKVGFVPVVQPEHPTHVHRACLEAMYGSVKQREATNRYGTCPACGGDAPVVDGRIQPHGAWRVNGEAYESDEACLGVNMRPRGSL